MINLIIGLDEKDIISLLPEEVSLNILSLLDFKSLIVASMV